MAWNSDDVISQLVKFATDIASWKAAQADQAAREQSADSAQTIPIVWGTARVSPVVIEREPSVAVPLSYIQTQTTYDPSPPYPGCPIYNNPYKTVAKGTLTDRWPVPSNRTVQVIAWQGCTGVTEVRVGTGGTDYNGASVLDPAHYTVTNGTVVVDSTVAIGASLWITYNYDFTRLGASNQVISPNQGYSHPMAFGLCEGAISGIGAVWADKTRYDTIDVACGMSRITGSVTTWIDDQSQTQNPTATAWGCSSFIGRADAGLFNGALVYMRTGSQAPQTRICTGLDAKSGKLSFSSSGSYPEGPWLANPAVGDSFDVYIGARLVRSVIATGQASQSRPTDFLKSYTDTYPKTAVLYGLWNTGDEASIPSIDLEVKGIGTSGSVTDVLPSAIVSDVLLNRAGWTGPELAEMTSWDQYCTAVGLTLSYALTDSTKVIDLLKDLIQACNADALLSQGQLKIIPRCDQAIGSYTPNLTPVYDLTPDDFGDSLQVDRSASADAYNDIPVKFIDRSRDYSENWTSDPDLADMEVRGRKLGDELSLPYIFTPTVANEAAHGG